MWLPVLQPTDDSDDDEDDAEMVSVMPAVRRKKLTESGN